MPNRKCNELFRLDYAFDAAQNYLKRLQDAGAQFFSTSRYQIMYLNGHVTDLTRCSDVLKALEVHFQLKNLWCDRDIAANLWLKSGPLCQPLPAQLANSLDSTKNQNCLPKRYKLRFKQTIESGKLSQLIGEQNED